MIFSNSYSLPTWLTKQANTIFHKIDQWNTLIQQKLRILAENYPRLWLGGILSICAGAFLICCSFLLWLSVWAGVFGQIPSKHGLQHLPQQVASEVYSADGAYLGKYYTTNRTKITYHEIPQYLIDALIATEDARFYQHDGIDFRSLLRVLFKTILFQQESSGGGSTITQQLVKNLYPRRSLGILTLPVCKIKEMIIATRIEELYTKEEILTMYINTVPFGEEIYGIENASQRFFSKSPSELCMEETATLVGMLKANTLYHPVQNPELSEKRRNTVLHQMFRYHFISESTYDSVSAIPLATNYHFVSQHDGPAPYYRTMVSEQAKEILKEIEEKTGESYNLYQDGLQIYTTLDATLQSYAESAVLSQMQKLQGLFNRYGKVGLPSEKVLASVSGYSVSNHQHLTDRLSGTKPMKVYDPHTGIIDTVMSPLDSMKYYASILRAGFIAVDVHTGEVKAWVGGIDHRFFQYDQVTASRQVASLFKPVIYAAALEEGVKPCAFFSNQQQTIETSDKWTPRNADGKYGGKYTLHGALTHSVNTVSAQLLQEVGYNRVRAIARNAGVTARIKNDPTVALGTVETSLYEMAQVYATIANNGVHISPRVITQIKNSAGENIYEAPESRPTQAMTSETSQKLLKMLRNVANRGTAARLRWKYRLSTDLAGKTGTSQNQADGWFIGTSANLVAGAWVGGQFPTIHFRSMRHGQGASTALPIFAKFFQQIEANPNMRKAYAGSFPIDKSLVYQEFECPDFIEDLKKMEPMEPKLAPTDSLIIKAPVPVFTSAVRQ